MSNKHIQYPFDRNVCIPDDIENRIDRLLSTSDVVNVEDMILDVYNLFERTIFCNPSYCDFYAGMEKENKNEIFNDTNRLKYFLGGCCEGGSLSIPLNKAKLINRHIGGITEYMNSRSVTTLENIGWCEKVNGSIVTRVLSDNSCIFSIYDEPYNLCAIHLYVDDNPELELFDFKPTSCMLFPVDIIRVGSKLLITSVSMNTCGITRYGDYHISHKCLHNTSNHGLPIYKFSEYALRKLLGDKRYRIIDSQYKRWFGRRHGYGKTV